ncbi:hypothetical protein O5D80_002681 [Batrachochytrium dendrobatidis]|nr:hypothetical protein O5D80_002681 [Batrachochytrium dendrobatidis]
MKLVDILLVLTVATTVSAILPPADKYGFAKASRTSSRVSIPTNEPNPGTSDQDWQKVMDAINSSILDENWQNIFDPIDPITSIQDQQQSIDVVDPSTSKRSRKRPINEIRPSTFSQASGSTNEPSPSAPKQSRKQPMNQPIPSTSRQDQQQPMIHDESVNTVTNQVTGLSQKFQRTFNRIKQMLVEFKEIQKKKLQEYRRYANLKFSQQLALAMGKEISGPRYDPDTEKQLKQEYEQATKKLNGIRQRLKDFIKRHGLRFEESSSNSD